MSARWCIALVVLLSVALCLTLGVAGLADKGEKEEKVTLDQCPQAVQDTLNEQAEGGTINEIEKETKDGKVVYEAEITKDGKTYDVEVAEDGKLISSEADDEDDGTAAVDDDDDDDDSCKEETGDNDDDEDEGEDAD